jgi:hypothetical protein
LPCFFVLDPDQNSESRSLFLYRGLSNSQDFQTKGNNFIMKEVKFYDIIIHLPISFIKNE